jgi:hypothetical protein
MYIVLNHAPAAKVVCCGDLRWQFITCVVVVGHFCEKRSGRCAGLLSAIAQHSAIVTTNCSLLRVTKCSLLRDQQRPVLPTAHSCVINCSFLRDQLLIPA